jgi:exopolyphosphatase/guanosine-5'-triphosphate,3'-diphosphate pyrophosphatase
MKAAVAILRKYQERLNIYDVEQVRAVATSAVREAKNADSFLDRILVATGLEVQLISSTEESRLDIMALRNSVGKKFFSRGKVLIAEVGGGSTILNLIDRGEIKLTQSLAIGAIRIQEVLSTSSESPARASQMVEHRVSSAISAMAGLLPLKRIRSLVALGGDARWLCQQADSDCDLSGLCMVSCKSLSKVIEKYRDYSADKLARTFRMPYTEAETLIPALMVYEKLSEAASAKEIAVSEVTMRDGLLLDMAKAISGKSDESVVLQVTNSAEAMAAKYHVDMVHARHVRFIAECIYDELEKEKFLMTGHILLLQAAAILHEVGMFINSRAYHKHSYYIISHSEVFGLDPDELEMVAHIGRYHRRSRPKTPHTEYMRLPREQRMIINKLAAILRVADALDVNRTQDISDFICSIEDDQMTISVSGSSDLTLERRAVNMKADLFEEIYGLSVRLEQEHTSITDSSV